MAKRQAGTMTMNRLSPGEKAVVKELHNSGLMRRRLLDLGLTPGTVIEAVRKSPSGDPVAYCIRGAIIALRAEDSSKITVQPL